MEFAMREIANQGGAQRAQQQGLQQAADSARQRALYSQAYGDSLSRTRDQDFRTSQGNTNIINDFNRANTQGRNAMNNANVGLRNEGLKDKNYSNQVGKLDRQIGFNNQQAQISAAQAEQERKRNAAMMGAIGAGAGAMVGGPAGAGVGYSVGSSMG
jgi:hypothetical protein